MDDQQEQREADEWLRRILWATRDYFRRCNGQNGPEVSSVEQEQQK